MIATSTTRVVPADPALPSLGTLFADEGAPSAVCATVRAATGVEVEPEQATLEDVRYHPGKDCAILWSFAMPAGGRLLASAKLSRDGKGAKTVARPAFQELAERARRATGTTPYAHLPERRLLVQLFPFDSRLRGLTSATSLPWAEAALAQELGLADGALRIFDVEPLSYKPWRRCVLRYAAEVAGQPVEYIGKVFRDDRGQPLAETLRELGQQLAATAAPWEISVPACYLPLARMLVTEAATDSVEVSRLLVQALEDGAALSTLRTCAERIAEGLVDFGQVRAENLRRVSPPGLLQRLRSKVALVEQVAPALADDLQARLRALAAAARELPPEPVVVVHSALRHNHFLLRRGRLVLLDLDNVCLAGASADAGYFLAYLDRTALRRPRLQPAVDECEEVFVATLEQLRGRNPPWLAWYRSAGHVLWALRAFLSLEPRWPELAAGLLRLAEGGFAR